MQQHKKALQYFLKQHPGLGEVYLVGSLVYACADHCPGDVDLVILMESWEQWKNACVSLETEEFYTCTRRLYEKGKGHYFCVKFQQNGIKFSADFLFVEDLNDFIAAIRNKRNLLPFKLTNQAQRSSYLLGSGDEQVEVPKQNVRFGTVYGVSSDLFIQKDHFHLGILADKLLTGFDVCTQDSRHESSIVALCSATISHLYEDWGEAPEVVISSLARSERFTEEYKTYLCERIALMNASS